MELISIKDMPMSAREQLLKELGFGIDEKGYVLDEKGYRVKDKYINVEVKADNMFIAPGSILVLDDNPVSLASYLDEYEVTL